MNIENLKRAQEHLKTVPEKMFNMSYIRKSWELQWEYECKTIGCILGHSTILDTEENIDRFRKKDNLQIDFLHWSEDFFDLRHESRIYQYIFDGCWSYIPETNNIHHAVYRIQRILDGFEPQNVEYEFDVEKSKYY